LIGRKRVNCVKGCSKSEKAPVRGSVFTSEKSSGIKIFCIIKNRVLIFGKHRKNYIAEISRKREKLVTLSEGP